MVIKFEFGIQAPKKLRKKKTPTEKSIVRLTFIFLHSLFFISFFMVDFLKF